MVIPDWGADPRPQSRVLDYADSEIAMARPGDRIASTVVDLFVVLLPIYLIVSAPFKRTLAVDVLLGREDSVNFDLVALGVVALSLILIYQTLFIYKRGATLGQALFGLEVRPSFDGSRHLGQCAYRALLWNVGIVSFGLTWISVWTDPRRRTVHDRLANFVVVTRSPFRAASPTQIEARRAHGAIVAGIAVFLLAGLGQRTDPARMIAAEDGLRCSDQIAGDLGPNADSQARIANALTLFSAGLIERDCLADEVEADQQHYVSPTALSYLARAFVQADNPELSDKYLDAACLTDSKSSACAMAQLVGEWSEDKSDDGRIEQILKGAPRGSGFLEVWAIRHAMQSHRFALALSRLSDMEGHRQLASFIADQRAKALRQGRMPAAIEEDPGNFPEEEGEPEP